MKSSSQPMVLPVVSTPHKTVLSHKEYSEKREKERRERERAEMRDKHHPPVITSTASSHHHPNLVHGSSHLSSSSSSSSLHLRPLTTEPAVRSKVSEVPRSFGIPSSMRGGPTYKESVAKRDISQVVHVDDKVDKEERTSVNSVDSAKFLTDRLKGNSVSSDIMHTVSSDWNKSRHIDYTKVRKDLIKEKSVKHLIKEKVTENEKSIEGRETKHEVFPKHVDSKIKSENIAPVKVIKSEKSEPKVIKTEKSELKLIKTEPKDEIKVQVSVKDIKPNTNSFIFNNNDFSLRDFLNPSAMPPEDIFDTEVDSKPSLNNSDFFTMETTHHKLNSPPKQVNHSFNSLPAANSVTQTKGISASGTNQQVEPLHSNVVDSKPVSRQSNVNVTSSNNVNLHSNHMSDKNIGNGITGATNSLNTSNNSLPVSSSRKKDKLPSPQCLVSSTAKVKLQRLETTVLPPSIKFDDKHCVPTKDTQAGPIQSTPKGSHHISQKSGSTHATTPTVASSEKSANSLHSQQTSVIFNPTKLVAEPKKLDALNIRLTRPENCDSLSVVTTSAGSSAPLTNSSSVVSSPLKGHKSDHRHKHKEKKKHKHKEKDKHREKESKDHKKGKKHKKKDKEKDKDRKEDKKSEKQPSKDDSSRPLKITIKGISTPEVSATNAKTLPASPIRPTPLEKESSTSSAADKHGRIKLTIPKSRLQGNAAGSHASPPRGIPPKEVATPKVKLKIGLPKDTIKPEKEKESRKRERDRSSPDNNHQAKFARTSSSYHAPQVGKKPRFPHSTPLTKKPFRGNFNQNPSQHVHPYHSRPHHFDNKINTHYNDDNNTHFNNDSNNNPHYNNINTHYNQPVHPQYQQPPQTNFQPSYPLEQYGMNVNLNFPYNYYGPGMPMPPTTMPDIPMPPTTIPDPSFTHGNLASNPYYQHPQPQHQYIPQHYSVSMHNINIPSLQPQNSYQTYNLPPPNYSHEHSQQYVTPAPPPDSYACENPPLPLGSPPRKPPTPPPE